MKGEDKALPPGERPNVPDKPDTTPPIPEVKPPKNPGRDKSGDRTIKMLMAKEIVCSLIKSQRQSFGDSFVGESCEMSEEIFNYFHKDK